MNRKIARHLMLGYSDEQIAIAIDRSYQNVKHRVLTIKELVGTLNRTETVKIIMNDEDLLKEIYEL